MRTRGKRPARRMKPVFIVFCEGETEELYVSLLRQRYRSPIKIISRVEGCDISSKLIERRKREVKIEEHEKLTVFLMYDTLLINPPTALTTEPTVCATPDIPFLIVSLFSMR